MKKAIIGSIIGGLIIFLWQFLSFAAVNFHYKAQSYTDKQDAIMSVLNSQNLPEGGYILPAIPEGSTMGQHEAAMKAAEGKPWAMIQYHTKMENNMVMNMIRGLLANMVMVFVFCWVLGQIKTPAFATIVACCIATGLIVFINAPYTSFIWYKTFDIKAHLLDAVASWGLLGVWLGWYLRRGSKETVAATSTIPQQEMAG